MIDGLTKGLPKVRLGFSVQDYIPGQPIPTLILDPDDTKRERVITNPLKTWVRPFTLVTDPAVVTLGPGAVSEPIPMTIDGRGHFEIFDAFFQSDLPGSLFTVTLFDASNFDGENSRPILMNREIHVATFAAGAGFSTALSGSFPASTAGGRGFRWPQTFWMDVSKGSGAQLVAIFKNISLTQTQNIRFALHGRRWYYVQADAKVARRMEEIFLGRSRSIPFFYTTDQLPVLSGNQGATAFQMRFGSDAWTEWVKSSVVSTGLFNCTIQDDVDGRIATGQPQVPFTPMEDDLLFGSGEFPFLNWETTLFEPNFAVNMVLTDISGAQNTIWLTLACKKIFPDQREMELIRPGTSPGEGFY
jgi:hypothetical protein